MYTYINIYKLYIHIPARTYKQYIINIYTNTPGEGERERERERERPGLYGKSLFDERAERRMVDKSGNEACVLEHRIIF
jgi:hypothetical protein